MVEWWEADCPEGCGDECMGVAFRNSLDMPGLNMDGWSKLFVLTPSRHWPVDWQHAAHRSTTWKADRQFMEQPHRLRVGGGIP